MRRAAHLRHAGGHGALLVRGVARDRAGAGPRLPLSELLDRQRRLVKECPADMTRPLRHLLLVLALLLSQHAAMLHGLTHAEHDFAVAAQHGGKAPALNHGIDVCAAFGALAHALGNAVVTQPSACLQADAQVAGFDIIPAVTRVVFDSRAPPLSA
jgi:hypothetical protein